MATHRCKVPDPPADTTRWLGTYGDMVTLLMAFFVMLFAVSDTNAKKFEAFVSGLAGPFDNPAVSVITGSEAIQAATNPLEMIAPDQGFDSDGTPGIVTISEGQAPDVAPDQDEAPPTAEEVAAETAAAQQLGQVEGELEAALDAAALPISADVRDDERGLVVAISTDEVLFATGSAVLNPAGEALLAQIAPILRDAPNAVVVEGHTDDQALDRGGYTNWNLSTDRAVAVVEQLGTRMGVPFSRMSAGGYGEHRPLVPNDSPANRAKNRRVEILIVALDLDPGTNAATPGGAPPDAPPGTPAGAQVAERPGVLDFSEPLPPGSTPIASILGGRGS